MENSFVHRRQITCDVSLLSNRISEKKQLFKHPYTKETVLTPRVAHAYDPWFEAMDQEQGLGHIHVRGRTSKFSAGNSDREMLGVFITWYRRHALPIHAIHGSRPWIGSMALVKSMCAVVSLIKKPLPPLEWNHGWVIWAREPPVRRPWTLLETMRHRTILLLVLMEMRMCFS